MEDLSVAEEAVMRSSSSAFDVAVPAFRVTMTLRNNVLARAREARGMTMREALTNFPTSPMTCLSHARFSVEMTSYFLRQEKKVTASFFAHPHILPS
jgi:hypothetical protein